MSKFKYKNSCKVDHQQAEGFHLMLYRSDDGTEVELIWNSRDGVAPFVVLSRSGKEMRHVDWTGDPCLPDFKPAPGTRMFVDATPENVFDKAKRYVDVYWEPDPTRDYSGMNPIWMKDSGHWKSKEDAIEHFVKEWSGGGKPTLVEVEP